ncbi:MAG: hypothetical protein AABW59_05195 [archaeon]
MSQIIKKPASLRRARAQSSLEFLLVLAALLSALALILSSFSFAMGAFKSAGDASLASSIARQVQAESEAFRFLADGSKKSFEFSPLEKITIASSGTKVSFVGGESSFEADTFSQQSVQGIFEKSFVILIEKSGGKVRLSAHSS